MNTGYTKFDLYIAAIEHHSRELAIARINAERTSPDRVPFWEEVMEVEDKRLATVRDMAVKDGYHHVSLVAAMENAVERWDKMLRDITYLEVLP